MNIQTDFNTGEEVFFLEWSFQLINGRFTKKTKIFKDTIGEVMVNVYEDCSPRIGYRSRQGLFFPQGFVFKTELEAEEAIQKLVRTLTNNEL